MDPLIGATLIGTATSLLGGLLGQKAAREQAKQQMLSNIASQSAQLEQAGIQQQTQGSQAALSNLVEAYRTALLGK
jgi:hypothetical protein